MGLGTWIIARAQRRAPDFLVGGRVNPYMRRWWIIPRNRFFNIYLHQFLRDDEDRALHDHPWVSLSWMIRGQLIEFTKEKIRAIRAGQWTWRGAHFAHRLVVPQEVRGETWTLFITGPVIRTWGFHCEKGWRPWQQFVNMASPGEVGPGCD